MNPIGRLPLSTTPALATSLLDGAERPSSPTAPAPFSSSPLAPTLNPKAGEKAHAAQLYRNFQIVQSDGGTGNIVQDTPKFDVLEDSGFGLKIVQQSELPKNAIPWAMSKGKPIFQVSSDLAASVTANASRELNLPDIEMYTREIHQDRQRAFQTKLSDLVLNKPELTKKSVDEVSKKVVEFLDGKKDKNQNYLELDKHEMVLNSLQHHMKEILFTGTQYGRLSDDKTTAPATGEAALAKAKDILGNGSLASKMLIHKLVIHDVFNEVNSGIDKEKKIRDQTMKTAQPDEYFGKSGDADQVETRGRQRIDGAITLTKAAGLMTEEETRHMGMPAYQEHVSGALIFEPHA